MRLALILLAASLVAAEAPTITDAQRFEYRTLERDYYRIQIQIAALDAKAGEIKAQLITKHAEMQKACQAAQLDDASLTCKGK